MAAVTNANQQFKASATGTTVENHVLLQQVRQVAIRNTHATGLMSVKVYYGETSARALALATAGGAVQNANDTFTVQPGTREVVVKSPKARYVALSVICDTAATTYFVHGTDWFD